MAITLQKPAISFVVLGLFAFVMLSIFGLGHMGGMTSGEDGNMTGCIFTGKTMLCKMSVIEHISLWQSMFTAMPQESSILLALVILLVAVLFTTKNSIGPPRLFRDETSTPKLYLVQHPNLPFFNPLKEAFAQGILNPKIYEFANL